MTRHLMDEMSVVCRCICAKFVGIFICLSQCGEYFNCQNSSVDVYFPKGKSLNEFNCIFNKFIFFLSIKNNITVGTMFPNKEK